jgi:hypothetical protein
MPSDQQNAKLAVLFQAQFRSRRGLGRKFRREILCEMATGVIYLWVEHGAIW